MNHHQGLDNCIFTIDSLEKEIQIPGSSSHSDLNSTGSQSILTDSQTNFRFTSLENEEEGRMPTPTSMVRRWSQNLNKMSRGGKKNLREKTIYRLPSRKLCGVDGHILVPSHELEIEQLVSEIEQHDYLMQDSVTGRQIRLETIRALPYSLTTKRRLKEKLSVSVTQHLSTSEPDAFFKRAKDLMVFCTNKTYSLISLISNRMEIWYESMKEIEGHFGSSVGTYFKFLRWLFILNTTILVLMFSFVVFPQILYNTLPNAEYIEREPFSVLDLLTGDGYLKNSILFYGSYTNESFGMGGSGTYYSIPHAYFVTLICIYISTFIIISGSVARSYRRSFIETSGGIRTMFAHKIFCSWDFGISNEVAAQLKQKSLFEELQQVINELDSNEEEIPFFQQLYLFGLKVVSHCLVFVMIAGLGAGMWVLMRVFNQPEETNDLTTLYLPIVVNVVMVLLQSFFSWITKMEGYHSPRRSLHITLVRNFMLEATVIGVLVLFWMNKSLSGCWETSIGQEIYRIIIVDFFISVIILPLAQVIQVYIVIPIFPVFDKWSFDVSQTSLGLVFNQTLLWVGLLFAPFLSLVMSFKMVLIFYVRKLTLIYLSKEPTQLWRSAQTQTLYLVFTFVSLLGVIVSHGYIMALIPISEKCGPFRDYDRMFQIFVTGVLQLKENHWFWRFITAIGRPAVYGGFLLGMMVIVYYLRSKSKARGAMVKLLKDMLYLETKDKEFLLAKITKITKDREWMFEEEVPGDHHSQSQDQNNCSSTTPSRELEKLSAWRIEKNIPKRRKAMLIESGEEGECILQTRRRQL